MTLSGSRSQCPSLHNITNPLLSKDWSCAPLRIWSLCLSLSPDVAIPLRQQWYGGVWECMQNREGVTCHSSCTITSPINSYSFRACLSPTCPPSPTQRGKSLPLLLCFCNAACLTPDGSQWCPLFEVCGRTQQVIGIQCDHCHKVKGNYGMESREDTRSDQVTAAQCSTGCALPDITEMSWYRLRV